MNTETDLDKWNFQILMLVQAMAGAVSPNFRMVILFYAESSWVIRFYLEKDIEDDIEEIDEIICQYTSFQDCSLNCRSEIVISNNDGMELPEKPYRVVYKRKEVVCRS